MAALIFLLGVVIVYLMWRVVELTKRVDKLENTPARGGSLVHPPKDQLP